MQVHSALGDLEAAFRMLIAGSRTQASSSDAAAMEFLQPPHIELEALSQNKPKGSPEAAAQVGLAIAASSGRCSALLICSQYCCRILPNGSPASQQYDGMLLHGGCSTHMTKQHWQMVQLAALARSGGVSCQLNAPVCRSKNQQ